MYKVSRLLHLVRQNGLQHTVFIENTYPSKKKNDKEAFDNTGFLFFILFFFNCLVYEFMAALALIL